MLKPRHPLGKTQASSPDSAGRARRYGEAVVAAAIALGLAWTLRDATAGARTLPFWVMSLAVASRGGVGPALVASSIGAIAWELIFTTPFGNLSGLSAMEFAWMALYVGVSTLFGCAVDTIRRERRDIARTMDGMIDAMLVFDAEWRLQFVNPAGTLLLRRLGIDTGALRTQTVCEVAPSIVGTVFESESRRAAAERRVVEYEARYPKADVWLHVRCVPHDGEGVTVHAHDITTAQRAEQKRRRVEERYRALVESNTIMVWVSDPAGTVGDMPVWRELTGQTTEELRGDGWAEAIHPDDRAHARDRWRDAVEREQPYDVEYRLRHRDGRHHWYRSRAVPIREDRRIVEWVGVFDDIHETHRKRERHAAVDDALAVLGVSLDYEWNLAAVTRVIVPTLADYCSVDLVDASGAIRRVSSTHVDPRKEELLRSLWSRFPYHADDPGAPVAIRTGEVQLTPRIDPEEIVRFVRSADQAVLMEQLAPRSFLCVPMRSRGQVFGALSLVYAESERTYGAAEVAAVEQIALRAATAIENARLYADAQAANRAKGDFLATMSHELRTPLNAIAGYAELLSMGVRGPVTEDQRRDLGRIRQNQQHLLEIITDILNFSRIDAGHTRYSLHSMDVDEVLSRMEAVIEPQANVRSIRYEYLPTAEPTTVFADREKLEQVLINLLGNAVKFTPSGGRISLFADADPKHVRIHVRDTGVGIASELLASIFEPFVQLQPAFTRTAEGTGLGLAISRELARGMGGELRAMSEVGRGSVFTIELPRDG
jgi:PAS domain S-box-containing protein